MEASDIDFLHQQFKDDELTAAESLRQLLENH